MKVSTFRSATDNRPHPLEVTWLELVGELQRWAATVPHPDPHAAMSEAAWVAAKKTIPAWSPAAYPTGATRAAKNVDAVALLVADLDDVAELEVDAIRARLRAHGLAFVLHTTPSQVRAPSGVVRGRVVVPLSQAIAGDAATWKPAREAMLARLGILESADPQASDASRLYFVPVVGAVVETYAGDELDAVEVLERVAIEADARPLADRDMKPANVTPATRPRWSHDVARRADRALAYVEACPPAISGQRGHDATFAVALAVVRGFSLPIEIAREVLGWYGRRCSPPWTERELEHKIASAVGARIADGYLLEARP